MYVMDVHLEMVVEKLSSVDPLNTTPLNALNILYELKKT